MLLSTLVSRAASANSEAALSAAAAETPPAGLGAAATSAARQLTWSARRLKYPLSPRPLRGQSIYQPHIGASKCVAP